MLELVNTQPCTILIATFDHTPSWEEIHAVTPESAQKVISRKVYLRGPKKSCQFYCRYNGQWIHINSSSDNTFVLSISTLETITEEVTFLDVINGEVVNRVTLAIHYEDIKNMYVEYKRHRYFVRYSFEHKSYIAWTR